MLAGCRTVLQVTWQGCTAARAVVRARGEIGGLGEA